MAPKTILFLGVVVLLVVAAEASLTIYNPAKIQFDVVVDDKTVKVETDMMSMNITQAEQKMNITTALGGSMSVDVKDGDVLVILPDEPLIGVGNSFAPALKVVQVPGPDYAEPPADT